MAAMKRTASAAAPQRFLLWALFLLMITATVAAADTPTNPSTERASEKKKAVHEIQDPFGPEKSSADETTDEAPGIEDPCDWEPEGEPLQEKSREILRSWSCYSFRWFDSWWGDQYDFDEKAVNGLLTFGAEYRQYDGFDPRIRLKVRSPLPNLNRRWDLLLGRVDEDAYISDTQGQDQTFYNPGAVSRDEEPSWLLGLGYRGKGRRSGWDHSAGVRLRLPPVPYVKSQYYYNKDFSERSDLRFRQTFFWRSDRGFGTTSRADVAYGIDPENALRWEAIGTVHEETEGVEWYVGQTWYHLLGDRSAFSLRAFANGETRKEVTLRDAGFYFIWRRPFTREWLYLSFGPSITWPREFLEEKREMSLGFGLWLEMEFGNWRY
jgi:hypothetical protein